jgi:hypothetical protein
MLNGMVAPVYVSVCVCVCVCARLCMYMRVCLCVRWSLEEDLLAILMLKFVFDCILPIVVIGWDYFTVKMRALRYFEKSATEIVTLLGCYATYIGS